MGWQEAEEEVVHRWNRPAWGRHVGFVAAVCSHVCEQVAHTHAQQKRRARRHIFKIRNRRQGPRAHGGESAVSCNRGPTASRGGSTTNNNLWIRDRLAQGPAATSKPVFCNALCETQDAHRACSEPKTHPSRRGGIPEAFVAQVRPA